MGRAAFCYPYSYLFQVEGGPYQCGFCRFASTLDEVSDYQFLAIVLKITISLNSLNGTYIFQSIQRFNTAISIFLSS